MSAPREAELAFAKSSAALLADIRESQQIGIVVDQNYVNRLAHKHQVAAPILASTAAEPAKETAAPASAAEAKPSSVRSKMDEAEDYARRHRSFIAEARACFDEGTPLDQRFADELADRWGVLHSQATKPDPVVSASQRAEQLAFLSRPVEQPATEPEQPEPETLSASELAAIKRTPGATIENFNAAKRLVRGAR